MKTNLLKDLQRFDRSKNALRAHFIAPVVVSGEMPDASLETGWLELAKYIETVSNASSEEVETTGFYDGDGTPEDSVTSIAMGHTFEGYYDPQDPAMALVDSIQLKIGAGRKVWYKVVDAQKTKILTQRATVTEITCGAGEATSYEEFACTVKFDAIPTLTPIVGP